MYTTWFIPMCANLPGHEIFGKYENRFFWFWFAVDVQWLVEKARMRLKLFGWSSWSMLECNSCSINHNFCHNVCLNNFLTVKIYAQPWWNASGLMEPISSTEDHIFLILHYNFLILSKSCEKAHVTADQWGVTSHHGPRYGVLEP